jgi:hypothetical protein
VILESVISLLAVAAFALAFWWAGIVPVAREALKSSLAGLSTLMDSELDDDSKEVAVRRAGLDLIVASFSIFWRFLFSMAAAAAPIYLADVIGLTSRDAIFALMLRLDYIVVVSVGVIILAAIFQRRRTAAAEPVAENNRYSMADRFIHMVAFSSPVVLKTASWLEDRLPFEAEQESSAPPIFITSLARGGTTALLNALYDIPGIATHSYRDMPFLTAPNLWNWLAGGHGRGVDRQQRAHGDGLEIDLDSPEAFEEVIWKIFWPENFQGASIALWQAGDRKPKAEKFFKRHMEKVIRARRAQRKYNAAVNECYCSKNNTNIARIPYLLEAFSGCRIVVPVRRPECHAASLLRQHQNFLKLQAEDEFIRRYMRDIGHYEFGLIHKPIQFPGFEANVYDPTSGDYWLNYWVHAFREVLQHSDHCIFILQDDLRSSPQATMKSLCNTLDLTQSSLGFSAYFRPTPDEARTDVYSTLLYEEASEIYCALEGLSRSRSPSDA